LSFRLASLFGNTRRCNPADNFLFFDSFRTLLSADVEVQNANGAPGAVAIEDKPVTSSVSIVLEGAANGVIKLEQWGTGQALSPAWSDSHSSTSASTELMCSMPLHAPSQNAALAYAELEQLGTGQALSPAWSDSHSSTSASTELLCSMPLHAPSQNAALAYDLHSCFAPQERSFSDLFGGPAPVVYSHPAELHSPPAALASVSHAGSASAYPMQLAHQPVDIDCSPPMWATDTPGTHWQSDTPQCDEAQAHPEYRYMTQP
jgi:hypothetical protein